MALTPKQEKLQETLLRKLSKPYLNVSAIEREINATQGTVYKVMNGKRNFTAAQLEALEKYFKEI